MIAEQLRTLAVPLSSLNLDPSNARVHGEKNLAAIKSSLAQFGQREPVVVQRAGMIVRAGNGTVQAARALGWSEIAAVVIDDDNATAVQFAIADNRTAELAEWDPDTLALLLGEMDAAAQAGVGFEPSDVDKLLRELQPDLQDDEVPELPEVAVTKPGDLWVLGDHRLLCGDSTDPANVARLLGDAKPFLMVTDPPYGVDYEAQSAWFASARRDDVPIVEAILLGLEVEHRAAVLDYHADEALEALADLYLATRSPERYATTARRLGSRAWRPIEAMARSELAAKNPAGAVAVFAAADQPGHHQVHLRQVCLALTGVDLAQRPRE